MVRKSNDIIECYYEKQLKCIPHFIGGRMRRLKSLTCLFILTLGILVVAGCSDDDDDDIINPIPALGTFACDIDGELFTASIETWAHRFPEDEFFTITAFGGTGTLGIDTLTVGFYMVEEGDACPCIIMFGGFEGGMYDDATMTFLGDGTMYSTARTGAHGTLLIRYTSNSINGSFNFVAYRIGGSDSLKVTNGEFNLTLVDTVFAIL
jgi:hypothetical protein